MKKCLMPISLLCCMFLSGCASHETSEVPWKGVQAGMDDLTAITERTDYYDIVSESEAIFHLSPGTAHISLGMQFYSGEPIQLCAEGADVYLCRADGVSELLLRNVPASYTLSGDYSGWHWHLGQDGAFYCWHSANYSLSHPELIDDDKKSEAAFAKISGDGEIVYEHVFTPGVSVEDFCQSADGRCFLLLKSEAEQTRTLAELDSAAGSFQTSDKFQMKSPLWGNQLLGTAEGSLAVFHSAARTGNEITELNPADGTQSCLLSFTGTSYLTEHSMAQMQDFQMAEDGSVEILWKDSGNGAEATLERLQMAKVDKTPIVMRGNFMSDGWITKLVSSFNRQNGDYHVIIEDCGAENDLEDFARLTSIQLGAGKGPDIIQADFMQDYIAGMLEKGALKDLSPYMKGSGIREEDYFPFVFNTWRDGEHIYGINPRANIVGYRMDADILGGGDEPDIETLLDSLLSWKENAVYMSGMNSQGLLKVFLKGTDTLWGMVDWERGSCDFGDGLFPKMLEAAKRYGDDGRKGQLPAIAESRVFYDAYKFDSSAEQESAGTVTCGVLFDDGCHGAADSARTMAVNANSPSKEGAWEFLCFLLGDEAQSPDYGLPVSRGNFELWLERQKAQTEDGKEIHNIVTIDDKITFVETYTAEDLTDEKIAEYRKAVEEVKPYPIRTAPILDIILDESENYFNGSKSAAQVSEVITNRVQVYLDEIR